MRVRLRSPWLLFMLAVLLVGAVAVGSRLRPRSVETIPVVRRDLEEKIVTTGRVMSPARVELSTTLLGRVVAVNTDEGDPVKTGEILVQLDDSEARTQLARARAAVAKADAELALLSRVSAPLAQRSLDERSTDLEQARREHERTRLLFESGGVPQVELERAEQTLSVAQSQRDAAEVELSRSAPGGPEGAARAAGAMQARAELDAARVRMDHLAIAAPCDGVVLSRQVEPGEVVPPGKVLLMLARAGAYRISVQADERHLARLKRGQPATASADAVPDQRFPVKVVYLAPAVDPERGTVEVRLEVPNPPPYLRPEMTVSVNLDVPPLKAVLTVPVKALSGTASERPWVLVAANGRAERRQLEVGARSEQLAEVRAGLTEGEQVIVSGASVEAGTRIRARPRSDAGVL